MTEMPALARAAVRETEDFHAFLRDWLVGALPRTPAAFARMSGVMAPDLRVISPLGTTTELPALLTEFEGLHGALADRAGAFAITVEAPAHVHTVGDCTLVTYEEHHRLAGDRSARLATVLYRAREGTPNGVEWLHVHETWLPGLAPAGGERFPEAR